MTSTKGQKFFVTALLPTNSALSASPLDARHEPGAPVKTLLTSKAGTASVVRMLHVLEGKDSGAATPTTLVQSSAGTKYDGGVSGGVLVLFKRTFSDAFSSMTYAASGATKHYVAGLMPNRTYVISGAGAPPSAAADSGGLLIFSAAGTGSITVTASR